MALPEGVKMTGQKLETEICTVYKSNKPKVEETNIYFKHQEKKDH